MKRLPRDMGQNMNYNQPPDGFYSLQDQDKAEFLRIRNQVQIIGSEKGHYYVNFPRIFQIVKDFVVHNDINDTIRGFVCGILWLDDNKSIAINMKTLSTFLNKCKSTINAGLQTLGYEVISFDSDTAKKLVDKIPNYRKNLISRQWTLRIKYEDTNKRKKYPRKKQEISMDDESKCNESKIFLGQDFDSSFPDSFNDYHFHDMEYN